MMPFTVAENHLGIVITANEPYGKFRCVLRESDAIDLAGQVAARVIARRAERLSAKTEKRDEIERFFVEEP